jgi:AcrR family transcriptional regulator
MPPDAPLTLDRVLAAAEDVIRRFGPSKTTVVDVARALGVSHGSVYRHFRTKAALREAVTKRWLDRTSEKLAVIVAGDGAPEERLRAWLAALLDAKRHKAGDDPELFATYTALTDEVGTVVGEHIADLTAQLTRIITEGAGSGTFPVSDPAAAARAVFQATGRFHDPCHAREWTAPGVDEEFTAVVDLLIRGLGSPVR